MQLMGRALVHTPLLRVPGSSTAEFDGHVAPPWCVTCPPSSAIIWAYARLFSTSTYLTNHRSFHTDPARRMRMHAGNLERRPVWDESYVVGVLGAENSPRLWESHGADNLGTEVSG